MNRVILHADLNNFYASVECFLYPSLRPYPVAVCGDAEARHGIVLAKNQLAKKYGVATGDVIWQAQAKCPGLKIVKARHDIYVKFSEKFRRILLRYSPKMEPFGLDESWLDISSRHVDINRGEKIADEIRRVVTDELGLTASVGVSYNKVFAKLGSDIKKPNGTTVISHENYKDVVWPLSAGDLLYVGRKTKEKLARRGINTIGDIALSDPMELRRLLGKMGEMLYSYANGMDTDGVADAEYRREIKSIGNSTTTARDLATRQDVKNVLYTLCENVAARLKKYDRMAKCVQLYVRDSNLKWTSRQCALDAPTFLSEDIARASFGLFTQNYDLSVPVRSIGVRTTNLVNLSERQLDLFEDGKRIEREYAIEQIRRRFGQHSILRASVLEEQNLAELEEGRRSIFPGSRL